jgi:hypothetical protein
MSDSYIHVRKFHGAHTLSAGPIFVAELIDVNCLHTLAVHCRRKKRLMSWLMDKGTASIKV